MAVFRKVDKIYWKGRPQPLRIRLLLRWRWLERLQWWHVLLSAALLAGGALAWLALRPTADLAAHVVARVDGNPITEADLAAEAGGPVSAEQRPRLLEAVIDRRLLAALAGRSPAAHSPEALAAARRAQEQPMAAAMASRIVGPVTADDAAARRYIARHPALFAERQAVLVDAGPIETSVGTGPVLRQAKTLDDAIAMLGRAGIGFNHSRRVVDSGSVPAELAAQLAKVAPGQLFVMPMGAQALLGAVVERAPLVMPDAIQLEQARAGATSEMQQARLKTALKAMRAKAEIRLAR